MAKKQKTKKYINKYTFMFTSFVLGIFFIFSYLHNWANEFFIKLHFCNHTMDIVFSLIWFGFFIVGLFYIKKKKKGQTKVKRKMSKIWWLPFIVILIVGIILMNMSYCSVDGKIHFGMFFANIFGTEQTGFTSDSDERDDCKPGVDCPGDIVEVPIPPCTETDDGRDYISYGIIRSGVDIDDICLANGNLRERYCNSILTYTSEDIDCAVQYEEGWICEEGECRANETYVDGDDNGNGDGGGEVEEENTLTLCSDEIDNDDDGKIDCIDEDCTEFCECVYEGIFPSCLGYVDEGFVCSPMYTSDISGWCVSMPDNETPCRGSDMTMPIFCTGWCDYGMSCIHDGYNCYCSDFPCRESDGGYNIEVGGDCVGDDVWFYDHCVNDVLHEWQCLGGCIEHEIDCEELGMICETDKFGVGYCIVEEP